MTTKKYAKISAMQLLTLRDAAHLHLTQGIGIIAADRCTKKSLVAKGLAYFRPDGKTVAITREGVALIGGRRPFHLVGATQVSNLNEDAAQLALELSQRGGFAMKIDLRGGALMASLKAAIVKPPMTPASRRRLCVAMIRAERFIQEIVAATGYSEGTVRRYAELHELPVYRERHPRKATSGTIVVRRRTGDLKVPKTLCAYLPAAAIHAAGWKHGQELTFSVFDGVISIRSVGVPA